MKQFSLLNSLPVCLQRIIGKMIHSTQLVELHVELYFNYKKGVSFTIPINIFEEQQVKHRFGFIDYCVSPKIQDSQTTKFYELSKNIEWRADINGWIRAPYNYRNISSTVSARDFFINPRFYCIRNGNRNVAVLPARYFYSAPSKEYYLIKTDVESFIKGVPISSYVRGGAM